MGLEGSKLPLKMSIQEAASTIPEKSQQLRVSGRDRPLVAAPPRAQLREI